MGDAGTVPDQRTLYCTKAVNQCVPVLCQQGLRQQLRRSFVIRTPWWRAPPRRASTQFVRTGVLRAYGESGVLQIELAGPVRDERC